MTDLDRVEKAAEKLRKKGGYWRNFHTGHLMGWMLCKGQCAYCGEPLVARRMETGEETIEFASATTDHLLPQASYPERGEEALNAVLACSDCNSKKGNWDPGNIWELTMKTRDGLIDSARTEIQKRKTSRQNTMPEDVADWRAALTEAGLAD